MKHTFFLLFAAASFAFVGCDNSAKPESEEPSSETTEESSGVLKGMVPYDLSNEGFPIVLMVPDTSKSVPSIEFNNMGKLEVRVGKYYQLQIGEEADLELKRSDLADNLVFDATMLVEEPTGIVYRSDVKDKDAGVPSRHHFYAVVPVNGIQYELEDIDDDDPHTESSVKRMYEAAKALKASPAL